MSHSIMTNFLSRIIYLKILILIYISIVSCSSYELQGEYVNGIARAYNDYLKEYSYINAEGKLINKKALFSYAEDFSEGYGVVRFKDGSYGMVNENIEIVFKDCKELSSFVGKYAIFSIDGTNYGILDNNLRIVLKPSYKRIYNFSNGYARVSDGKNYGFIDFNMNLVVPCIYSSADDYSEEVAIVTYENQKGFLDQNGVFHVIPGKNPHVSIRKAYQKGDFIVFYNDYIKTYGLMNKEGEIIAPDTRYYHNYLEPSEGLIAFKSYIGWEYIDKTGSNPFKGKKFAKAERFVDGKAKVTTDNGDIKILYRDGTDSLLSKYEDRITSDNMSIQGRWKHRRKDGSVYTIKINGSSFEFWNPDSMISSGYVTRDGGNITLNGSNKYGDKYNYSVSVDAKNKCLIFAGDRYYK